MTDFQDKNNMSTNLEAKICANGDVGSPTLKINGNEQSRTLNGVSEDVVSIGTEKPEVLHSLEENVKLNGQLELKSEVEVSSTENSIEDKFLDQEDSVSTKIDSNNHAEDTNLDGKDTEVTESSGQSAVPADNSDTSFKTTVVIEPIAQPTESTEHSDTFKNIEDTESIAQPTAQTENSDISIDRNEDIVKTELSDVQTGTSSVVDEKSSVDVEITKDQSVKMNELKNSNSNEENETCNEIVKTSDVSTNNQTAKTSEPTTTQSGSLVIDVNEESACVEVAKISESTEVVKSEETNHLEENACTEESSSESTKLSEIIDSTIQNSEKSIEKVESDSCVGENNLDLESKPVIMDPDSVTSEAAQDDAEKMEVDESEPTSNGSELSKTVDEEKTSALNTDCRVVLVKMNESQPENGDLDSSKKMEVSTECNKGVKRKRDLESDSSDDDTKSDGDKKEENTNSPVKKNKKQKLEGDAEKTSPERETQQIDEKSPSSARKSKRLSNKSKETKNDEEPESEKSPSKRSRQSTPRKSITPSPRSRSRKELQSTDEKSASENDRTPQKNAGTRASPRSKRMLNLDDDEEAGSSNASKKTRQLDEVTPKNKAVKSSDEDQGSEDESTSRSTKKSRNSKSKNSTRSAKKSAAKFKAERLGSESDDEAVDNSKKNAKSRRSRSSPADATKLEKMKRLLVAANLKVNNYNKFFKDCNTEKEKITHIENFLRENGLKGTPTLKNCQKLGKKIEKEKEAASLDKSNILDSSPSTSGTRVTRSRRSVSRRA